jgi:hypothetical protein
MLPILTGPQLHYASSKRRAVFVQRLKQFNQQDATVSQVYYLTFMCGSTCFGRLPVHYQEHTTALGASGFTVTEAAGALLVVVWQTTTNNAPAASLQR